MSLSAQTQNCNAADPLFDFYINPSCMNYTPINQSVCYKVEALFSNGNQEIKYFKGFVDWNWSESNTAFTTPEQLAQIMTNNSPIAGSSLSFKYDVNNGLICLTGEDIEAYTYSKLKICYALNCENGSLEIEPQRTGPPTFSESISGIGTPNLSNPTLFNNNGTSISTSDFTSQISDPNAQNTTGFILNSVQASGGFEALFECADIDCIDLSPYAEGIFAQIDQLDESDFEEIDYASSGLTFQQFLAELKSEVSEILADDSLLVNSLNTNLGWNLSLCNGYGNKGTTKGNKVTFASPPPGGADPDYFSKEIPGIGLNATNQGMQSQSTIDAIKNISGDVSLYNGSQSTNIPLYTFQANDISLPIGLSSSNNGLKVDDIGSSVGQNWNLNAGGKISRVVKGLPDEFSGSSFGKGIGRSFKFIPRFEALSNIGVGIDLPSANLGCEADTKNKIVNGFPIFKIPETVLPTTRVIFKGLWRPTNANMINIDLTIRIPTGWPGISILLNTGVQVGVGVNEKLGMINYQEEGLGYLHTVESGSMDHLVQPQGNHLPEAFPADGKIFNPSFNEDWASLQLLKGIHPNRYEEDGTFLNAGSATYEHWNSALRNAFGKQYTVKTEKIDSEPDEFHFSFGTYNGKFMFRPDGHIVMFPDYPGVSIEYNINQNEGVVYGRKMISSFIVKTPEGMEYLFGNDEFSSGVDVVHDKNYYLPNFYTYPEIGTNRDNFDRAQIDRSQLPHWAVFGPIKKIDTYPNTFDRNFKVMEFPNYSSTWHLVSVRSLLSLEEVTLEYEKCETRYYANKSFNHTFPNFEVGATLRTEPNDNMDWSLSISDYLGHQSPTKWENGRAEFSYSVTERKATTWVLNSIEGKRGEKISIKYEDSRKEIVGDKLCKTIKVLRRPNSSTDYKLYKGWNLSYKFTESSLENPICNPNNQGIPQISIPGELTFKLGTPYEPKWFEYQHYISFNFLLGYQCWRFPISRIPVHWLRIGDDLTGQTELNEYGSLMLIKDKLGIYEPEVEKLIYT